MQTQQVASGNLVSGLLVMLDAHTPAIVLGPGGCRDCESVPLMAGDAQIGHVNQLVFHPISGQAVAYWYKTEWHVRPLACIEQDYPRATWTLGWSYAGAAAVASRAKYVAESVTIDPVKYAAEAKERLSNLVG